MATAKIVLSKDFFEALDHELEFYVKGVISDDDYRQLQRNLADIVAAEIVVVLHKEQP